MSPAISRDGFASLVDWLGGEGRGAIPQITPGDRLLWWLSEKARGSWLDFRRAHAWVTSHRANAEPAWIAARELQALGHVEFAWDHDLAWSVAPPVLTLLPNSDGLGYLTGARSRSLVEALNASEAFDFYPEAVLQDAQGPHGIFLLFGSPGVAEALARHLEIEYTFSVAETLASVLPALPDMIAHRGEEPFRLGFERELFNPQSLFWDEADEREEHPVPGLYRMRTWGHTEYRFVTATRRVLSCQPEPGFYEALRYAQRVVVHYDQEATVLVVPAPTRLPPLHARAATLSSGLLPRFERTDGPGELHYENVSPAVAKAILQSLSQVR